MDSIKMMSAGWCGPCKSMKKATIPQLEMELANTNITFEIIDVDQNPSMTEQYQVKSVPTLLFLRDGVEMDRVVGSVGLDRIKKSIKSAFSVAI